MKKYYDYDKNVTKNFTSTGHFAIALKGTKEDINKINKQIEKLQKEIINKDEISYIMNLFSTPNIFKIDSLLREIGVINHDNTVNPEKIINIDKITLSGNGDFIKKYEMIFFSNQIIIDFSDEFKDFFVEMYNILIESPVWTGHVYPIEYVDINNLYTKAMNLVKKIGMNELYDDMYEVNVLSEYHVYDNTPNPFLYYNAFYIKGLSKGIKAILNHTIINTLHQL